VIGKLLDIISREATLFESFLHLLDRQRDCLVRNDTEHLAELTELMREKVIESQLLNDQREQIIRELKAAKAIDGDLTVSRLLEILDAQEAGQLQTLRDTILDLNKRITVTRQQNEMLLDRSRGYIQKTLELLAQLEEPTGVYLPGGTPTTTNASLVVDRRA
jgi:flagellar biosynthesis/type III secretory pathway chaperone